MSHCSCWRAEGEQFGLMRSHTSVCRLGLGDTTNTERIAQGKPCPGFAARPCDVFCQTSPRRLSTGNGSRVLLIVRMRSTVPLLTMALCSLHAEAFDVAAYGARGDGTTVNTAAIQKAIDAAAKAGNGVVVLQPGVYLSGALFLKSHMELRLDLGAEIDWRAAGLRGEFRRGFAAGGFCIRGHRNRGQDGRQRRQHAGLDDGRYAYQDGGRQRGGSEVGSRQTTTGDGLSYR